MRKLKKKYKELFVKIGVASILVLGLVVGFMFLSDNNSNNSDTNKPDNNGYVKVNQLSDEDKKRLDTAIELETKYISLYFPSEYKDNLEVKYSEDAGYKAEFYGKLDGKKGMHLFDICFNSDDGYLLGYLNINDEIINMSYEVQELKFDDKWQQEEKDTLYSMQEEVNFVLSVLGINEYYVEP